MKMERITFFDTIKMVIEQHLHYLSVDAEQDKKGETENSYKVNLYRPHLFKPTCTILLDKKTGELVNLSTTFDFGESGAFIHSLFDAINDIKERRRSYVTRT